MKKLIIEKNSKFYKFLHLIDVPLYHIADSCQLWSAIIKHSLFWLVICSILGSLAVAEIYILVGLFGIIFFNSFPPILAPEFFIVGLMLNVATFATSAILASWCQLYENSKEKHRKKMAPIHRGVEPELTSFEVFWNTIKGKVCYQVEFKK